jgi:hypothetical protein
MRFVKVDFTRQVVEQWPQNTIRESVVVQFGGGVRDKNGKTGEFAHQVISDGLLFFDGNFLACTRHIHEWVNVPGHPIHVKAIIFFNPDKAETRPPLDMRYVHSPASFRAMLTGNRFEITIKRSIASRWWKKSREKMLIDRESRWVTTRGLGQRAASPSVKWLFNSHFSRLNWAYGWL